jgi:hypothetical protein
MKHVLYVSLAVLAVACNNGRKAENSSAPAATAQSGSATQPVPTTSGASAPVDQLVSVVGCLEGGKTSVSGGVGTAGSQPGSITDKSAATAGVGGGRFVLTHAQPATASNEGSPSAGATGSSAGAPAGAGAGTGVGANGAGGSSGPLVSGLSSYALEGNASELQPHLNHQVRVAGRLNSRTTAYDTPRGDANARAGQPEAAAPTAGNLGTRTIVVESVQMVAPTCSAR